MSPVVERELPDFDSLANLSLRQLFCGYLFDAIAYEVDCLNDCATGSIEIPPLRFASVGKLGVWFHG